MTEPQSPIVWAHDGGTLAGTGSTIRFDPGTGPGRYQAALDALLATDRPLGFASFTFDPEQNGSVVLIPERVTDADLGSTDGMPKGAVTADGVDSWNEGLSTAQAALQRRSVDKVVLCRQVEARFDDEIPINALLSRLQEAQAGCYVFAIDGLVGASPELLASVESGVLTSITLAGTAAAGEDLGGAKITEEHGYAARSVERALEAHADLTTVKRTVLQFGEIRHLATVFSGRVAAGVTVLDILEDLHPTAAVAGSPTERALQLIRAMESRPRGRYAGPAGWFDRDGNGEFAIALRCGLVAGHSATLYAGGGIVAGSDRDAELAETRLKLGPMMGALGLE